MQGAAAMRSLPISAILAFVALPAAAWAQDDVAAISAGRALGLKWCSECHLVEKGQPTPPSDAVPSWYAVAKDPATTEAGLHAFFATPHKQMPNIMLTRQETDEIIAYILSLKSQ
jgi:mono/diheme cytochrome c family protein